MLQAILNKSWWQHPTRHQLYGHLPPIMKTIQVRRTRHAGHCSVMYSYGPPHMAKQKQDDQLEHIYSSYVRIYGVALKTCQKLWMIGRSGERGSGISVLVARHDDDIYKVSRMYIYIYKKKNKYIYIYIYIYKVSKVVNHSRGSPGSSFSIATIPRYEGGHYKFPCIAPLYSWYIPSHAEC